MAKGKKKRQAAAQKAEAQELSRGPDSAVLPLVADHSIDISVPGYRVIKQIGHGAQGKVYLGERCSDGKKVAIKQLNIESVKNWKEYELFQREAEVLSKLDINGVARFYDAFECLDAQPPYSCIVQEYIDGSSLADIKRSGKRLKVSQVYEIVKKLLELLRHLHLNDPPVIHRDIKPSNIMIKQNGDNALDVYLIDFGAVANPQVQSGGSTVAGTFGYMPPEQLMGRPVASSDIYALAAVAVEMLTGIAPSDLPQKDFRLIFEPQMHAFPPQVVNTLRCMLDPDCKKRICHYDELIALFDGFSNDRFERNVSLDLSGDQKIYTDKLLQVKYYGEQGNLELWQALPEELPRKKLDFYQPVTDYYLNHIRKYEIIPDRIYEASFSDEENMSKSRKIHLQKDYIDACAKRCFIDSITPILVIFSLFFVFFFIGIAIFRFNEFVALTHLTGVMEGVMKIVLFVMLVLSVIGWLKLIIFVHNKYYENLNRIRVLEKKLQRLGCRTMVRYSRRELREFKLEYGDALQSKIQTKDINCGEIFDIEDKIRYLKNILKNGEKTIATITNVQYVDCSAALIEHNDNAQNSDEMPFCYHGLPLFRIDYRFKLPNDSRSDDLIHHIFTRVEPENHYRPGDLLPILCLVREYRLQGKVRSKGKAGSVVLSTPWPMPPGDLFIDRVNIEHWLKYERWINVVGKKSD